MCVKEGCTEWARGEMDFEDFRKIVPYFRRVRQVVLEGWGESLLYPRLDECIRLVKKEGAKAGLVTSGTELDQSRIGALLDSGLDFIGFSFSGATAATHSAIRKGSDFDSLVESVRMFRSLRKGNRPLMHIVYLMLRSNIEETIPLIALAKGMGIGKVALVNAILISTREQDEARVFSGGPAGGPENRHYNEILKRASDAAEKAGIELIMPPLSPMEAGVCGENPLKNLYISVNGEVSPCVYLYPPVPSPFARVHFGEALPTCKVSFGNIFRQPFAEIWNNPAYVDFRNCFQARERFIQRLRQASFGLDPGSPSESLPKMPDAPEPCRTCHKLSGL